MILALVVIPACAPTTPVGKAGNDQEITRAIMRKYREDPRLERLGVTCVDRVITLEGRVDTRGALEDAVRIARDEGRGSQVVSKIVVMPR
jgi:osmotically-inducible protein OsmY